MEKETKKEMLDVFEKISKVMEDVEYLQKDDKVITNTSTGAGYKAISEEKVTGEIRKSLIKNGLVIIPIAQEHIREDENVNGKINRLTTVNVTYRIQNIEDKDDYILAVSSGTGVDTQDKGIGKAMTYAYKYLLLRTFAIPTGEDTDKISSEVYSEQFEKPKEAKMITEKQVELLKSLVEDIPALLEFCKVEKIEDITMAQASEIIKKKGGK